MKKLLLTVITVLIATKAYTADMTYQETVLPNGMKVVTREDRSVPLVAVVIMIRAGSAYETPETSGMSHLLEHLVFDGAGSRSREEIKSAFDRMGGYVNAYTRETHVGHEIVMPVEFAAEGIRLQADMLLSSIIPEQELAKEKNVVIEEIKASKSQPYSVVVDLFDTRLYKGTPYERPVLGTEQSVQDVTRDSILRFYRRHYHPANMTAFVVGDINHKTAVNLIKSAYPAEPEKKPSPPISGRPIFSNERLLMDAKIPGVHLEMAVAAPHPSSPDAGPFQLLVGMLAGGDDSRLYRRLVRTDKPVARNVSAVYEPHPDHAVLRISVMLTESKHAGDALGAVLQEMGNLAQGNFTAADIKQAPTDYKAGEIFGTERLLHLARELAAWQAVNDYNYKTKLLASVSSASPDTLAKTAKSYFTRPDYLAILFGPEAMLRGASLEPSYQIPQLSGSSAPPVIETESVKGRVGRRTVKRVLENGLIIAARENPYADIVSMNILIKNRSALEPEDLPGIGNFDSMMLDEGTSRLTGEEISRMLAASGARIQLVDNPFFGFDDYYLSRNYSYIRLESLGESFDYNLKIISDMVQDPVYPEERLEAVRNEILGTFRDSQSSSYATARRAFFSSLFPGYHFEYPINGTPESISAVTRKDLAAYHQLAYAPNNMIITLVGNRPAESMIESVVREFGSMPRRDLPKLSAAPYARRHEPAVLIKQMQSEQAAIYIGNAISPVKPELLPAVELMNEMLSARLNQEVREKLGLAYSVGSETEVSPLGGWFYAALGTRPENFAKAKEAVLKELNRLRDQTVSVDELEMAKSAIWGRRLRYRQSRLNQAYFLGYAEYLGAGYESDDTFIERLKKLTPDDVRRTARDIIQMPGYTLSAAGNIGNDFIAH